MIGYDPKKSCSSPAFLSARDEAQRERLGAADGAVGARRQVGRAHRVGLDVARHLGGFAEGVAGVQRRDVRVGDRRRLGELLLSQSTVACAIAVVHPEHQARAPTCSGSGSASLDGDAVLLHRRLGQLGDVERKDPVRRQGLGPDRVLL